VTAVFAVGEGAPVVVVECDEVLQLGRGKEVRKLQEIARIGGSGRSSPGNGGRWRRSVGIRAREGLPLAGGGGPGAGSGSERCGAREGDRRGVGDGGADGVSGAVRKRPADDAVEREKEKERGSGRGSATRAGQRRGAWPQPAGDARQRPEHGARVAGRKQIGGGC
jgi:hypothetical protein